MEGSRGAEYMPVVRVGSEKAARLTAWNEFRRPRGTREVACGSTRRKVLEIAGEGIRVRNQELAAVYSLGRCRWMREYRRSLIGRFCKSVPAAPPTPTQGGQVTYVGYVFFCRDQVKCFLEAGLGLA